MTVWERYSLISIFFQVLSVLNPFTKINLFISNSFFHCQHEGICFLTLFFASLFLKYFCFHCESVFDSLIIFLLTAFSFPVHLITSPSSSHLVKKKKKASWVFCLHFPSYLTVSTILGKKTLPLGSLHRYFEFPLATFLSHLIKPLLVSGHVSLLTAQKVQFSVVWLFFPHFQLKTHCS